MKCIEVSEILGTAETAIELGITQDWVRQLVRRGQLKSLKTRRGRNVFLGEEVQRFKAARQKHLVAG